jgi:hypothetical protein
VRPLGERAILERRRSDAGNRAPGFFEPLASGIERHRQRRAGVVTRLEPREAGLEVQADGGEILRERVVDIARDPRTFVVTRSLDRLLGESRPFDRDADLIRNRRQQIELLARQAAPAAHREVHHAERPLARVERHAGMAAQPGRRRGLRRRDGRRQAAAFDDVDVARGQLTFSKQLEAPAGAPGHAHRLLEIRREVLNGGIVEMTGVRLAQPDPAGLDAEQIDHAAQGFAGRALLGRRAVQRFGDFLEHPERAGLRQAPPRSSLTNAHNLRF